MVTAQGRVPLMMTVQTIMPQAVSKRVASQTVGALALTLAWAAACWAAQVDGERLVTGEAQFNVEIGVQSLGSALEELAQQTGIQVIYFSQLTEGLSGPAVRGRYTLQDALDALLKGSGLSYRMLNANTVEVQSAPAVVHEPAATTPPARHPSGQSSLRPLTEAAATESEVIISTVQGFAATRLDTPVQGIPQTVSILSPEQLHFENDYDLGDALRFAPGITVVQDDSIHQVVYSRGFGNLTFHIDGGAPFNALDIQSTFEQEFLSFPDLGEYDHVEVLRGSDALFGGNGDPGASINLIRKRPTPDPQFNFSAFAGSWNHYRLETDLSGPLSGDGKLSGRLDAVYTRKQYFFDTANLARKKIFAVLQYEGNSGTAVRVGGSYEWINALPDLTGLPRLPDGSDPHLPHSTAYTFNWSNYHKGTGELYAQLEQAFGDHASLRINATQLSSSTQFAYGTGVSPVDPATGLISFPNLANLSTQPNTLDQLSFDATLTAQFDWLGRRHTFAAGFDYTRITALVEENDIYLSYPVQANAYQYDPGQFPDPRTGDYPFQITNTQYTSNQRGFYASFETHLLDPFVLTVGARLSADRSAANVNRYTATQGVSGILDVRDTWKLTPYAALMYQFGAHYSAYFSYADISRSNGPLITSSGHLLPKMDGNTAEVGIKGSWREGALMAALALYGVQQQNVEVLNDLVSGHCCFSSAGIRRSRGLDVEVTGRPIKGWLLGGSYSYNIYNENIGLPEISSPTATPHSLFKLWTSFDLPGRLRQWTIGGDLYAQSSNYNNEDLCLAVDSTGVCTSELHAEILQKPHAIVGLRAAYRIDRHLSASARINNVFSRTYLQTVGEVNGGNWYGAPRAWELRIDASY